MIHIKIEEEGELSKVKLYGLVKIQGYIDLGKKIIEILISNENFANDDYLKLAKYLEKIPHLKSLTINDPLEPLSLKAISEVAPKLVELKSLNLSSSQLNRQSTVYLSNLIRENINIESLDISENKIDDAGCSILMEALKSSDSSIKVLKINDNYLTDKSCSDISEFLQNSNSIQRLYLQKNKMCSEGISKIVEALENHQTIDILDISNNLIDSEGATAISKLIKQNDHLKELYLYYNKIGNAGISEIGKALEENKTLKHLDIGNNEISADGIRALKESLTKNNSIFSINANNNNFNNKIIEDSSSFTRTVNGEKVRLMVVIVFLKTLRIAFSQDRGDSPVIFPFTEFVSFYKDLNPQRRSACKIHELIHPKLTISMLKKIMEEKNILSQIMLIESNWTSEHSIYGFKIIDAYLARLQEESLKAKNQKAAEKIEEEANFAEKYEVQQKENESGIFMRLINWLTKPFHGLFKNSDK